MTFLPTGVNPLVERVRAAAALDETAARQAVHFAAYDALHEAVDESVHKAADVELEAQSIAARRALVRTFISRRVDGEGVDSLLPGALAVGAVSATIAKRDTTKEKRGSDGRWVKDVAAALTGGQQSGNRVTGAGVNIGIHGRKYDALHSLGGVLSLSPHTSAVGAAAQVAAGFGPEAERVLGPHLLRAAYRYRGTDLRPDQGLVSALATLPPGSRSADGKRGPANEKLLNARGDFGVQAMDKHVPSAEDYMVSVQSGELPPSRGVIIDAKGNLAATAVGYRGDHFLPFNLRNLGALQGGQYVRTRAAGGPTKEDLYTAVVGGARQIQVVSNSGVFTVEFDPDMRGGRRYSDKAARMVSRYDQILSSIGQGQITQGDLPKEKRDEIRSKIIMENPRATAADLKHLYTTAIKEEQERQEFSVELGDEETGKEIRAAIDDRLNAKLRREPNPSKQKIAELRQESEREVMRGMRNNTYRKLQLDGEGYERALRALAVEFPQFITKTDRTERDDFIADRFGRKEGSPRAFGQFTREPGKNARGESTVGAGTSALNRRGAKASETNATSETSESSDDAKKDVVRTDAKRGEAPSFDKLGDQIPQTAKIDAQTGFINGMDALFNGTIEAPKGATLKTAMGLGAGWRKPASTLQFIIDQHGGKASDTYEMALNGTLQPDEQAAFTDALASPELNNIPEDNEWKVSASTVAEGLEKPRALLALTNPFSGKSSSEQGVDVDNLLKGGKPPAFDDILAAGASTEKLKKVQLSTEANAYASKIIANPDSQKRMAAERFDDWKEAHESGLEGNIRDADAAGQDFVRGASYAAAWRAALAFEKLKGVSPSPFPEAPQGAPATEPQPAPVAKRVVFLDPVSPIAKRMRAALLR